MKQQSNDLQFKLLLNIMQKYIILYFLCRSLLLLHSFAGSPLLNMLQCNSPHPCIQPIHTGIVLIYRATSNTTDTTSEIKRWEIALKLRACNKLATYNSATGDASQPVVFEDSNVHELFLMQFNDGLDILTALIQYQWYVTGTYSGKLLEHRMVSYWNIEWQVTGTQNGKLLEHRMASYWNIEWQVTGTQNGKLLEHIMTSYWNIEW